MQRNARDEPVERFDRKDMTTGQTQQHIVERPRALSCEEVAHKHTAEQVGWLVEVVRLRVRKADG